MQRTYAQIQKRKHKQRTMVVPNNINSSMNGWKHLLDDHRDMVDDRHVPASVASVPAPAPVRPRRGRRLIPQTTNPIPTPPKDKSNTGMNTGILREGRQASAVAVNESMTVFFQQANTGRYRPIHRPIPRMPVGLGTKLTSTKSRCVSERDIYTIHRLICQQHHTSNTGRSANNFLFFESFLTNSTENTPKMTDMDQNY